MTTNNILKTLAVVIVIILVLLSLGGGGWSLYNNMVEELTRKNDSLIEIQDTIIARKDREYQLSQDSIQIIKQSKIVYIDNDLKWKRKYEALQKDYDVILYKLYSQQYLDSLAKHFLFRK